DVADREIDLAPARLDQQRTDLQRARVPPAQVPQEVVQGEPRVDDVLDDQDVLSLDRRVEVLQDPHHPGGIGQRAIAGHRHEVELAGQVDRAHQVGQEEDRSLQDPEQQDLTAAVVAADLGSQLAHARL